MRINFYQARAIASSTLLMVGPVCILGAYAMAGLAYAIFPYGWSWNLCCAFGGILKRYFDSLHLIIKTCNLYVAILCATDPVSVLAVLRRVNINPGLTMLITGESLLNDASAIVLFNLYGSALGGDQAALDPGAVITYFVKVIFISPLLGLGLGGCAVIAFKYCNRRKKEEDVTIQVCITIGLAFLSFFIGESIVHVSGVVCCVISGYHLTDCSRKTF